MTIKYKSILLFSVIFYIVFLLFSQAFSQDSKKPNLTEAVICEVVKDRTPQNQAAVFSISAGKIFCFTNFDPVPEKTVVYHNWFRTDILNTKIKLVLNPPKWSTFSSIQLRESDKGPWRVEVTDSEGNILNTVRFSITD
ncbi:MAG: hypothetical protein BWK80_09800 [Desulfobacteraceae bacterium IS3]|nr:MAG: hypothetical protein BWK80_09800 [Desulfobacteraceae bacterium IS3]